MSKQVAFLIGNPNTDIHDIVKELAKWGKIDVYDDKAKGYKEVKDNVTYLSRQDWGDTNYDMNVVVDGLTPFLDNYMKGNIYVWLKSTLNLGWNGTSVSQALMYNIRPFVTAWITEFETKGLDNVVNLKSVDEWRNLLGLNFEMKYKDDVKQISKPQNSSYFLHPSKLLGDTEI